MGMSCCHSTPTEENQEYEDIDFYYNSEKSKVTTVNTVNFKNIIDNIPVNIFDLFTLSINVFTNESITLHPCEATWVKTNILVLPYLPFTCSINFHGVINGFSVKSSNQSLLPLKEEILSIRLQNFNKDSQNIPIGMPIGKIVIQSKNYWEL